MIEWIMSAEDIDDITSGRFTVGQKLVRCKDCKHFKKPLSPDMWGWCKKVSMDNKATVEDWFCADGERKDDA